MKRQTILCTTCGQPFHGLTNCEDAASPRIKALLAQARDLREQLWNTETQLRSLNYQPYDYSFPEVSK